MLYIFIDIELVKEVFDFLELTRSIWKTETRVLSTRVHLLFYPLKIHKG